MLGYHLRHAARSLRRTPFLSWTMAVGLGLGIAGSTTAYSVSAGFSGCPVPGRIDTLHHVTVARQANERMVHPFANQLMHFADWHLSYEDARRVLAAQAPGLRMATFSAPLFVRTEAGSQRHRARFATRDFFAMFEVPFSAGAPWSAEDERAGAPACVLSRRLAERFGGAAAVGRTVTIQGLQVRVAGVLADYEPSPRVYDFGAFAFHVEDLYLPLEGLRAFDPVPDSLFHKHGRTARGDQLWTSDESFLQVWIDADASALPAWRSELDAAMSGGRVELSSLRRWLQTEFDVPMQGKFFQLLSNMLLLASCLSLIRLLLAKFLARAPEVAVHRALGASRGAIFLRHVLEAEMLALAGGVLGYLGAIGSFAVFYHVAADYPIRFATDLRAGGVALATALVSGLIVGIYPAWRICQAPPVTFLGRA